MLETEKLYIDNKQLYYRVTIKMDLLKIMRIHQQLVVSFVALGNLGAVPRAPTKFQGVDPLGGSGIHYLTTKNFCGEFCTKKSRSDI